MSGLALILAGMGRRVSGSDIEENAIIKKLRKKGMDVAIGHGIYNVKDADLVVYSSSIKRGNPELRAAV